MADLEKARNEGWKSQTTTYYSYLDFEIFPPPVVDNRSI